MKTRSLKAVVTALLSATILIASNSVFAGGDKFECWAEESGIDKSMDARLEIRGQRMKFDVSFEVDQDNGGNFEDGDVLAVNLNGIFAGTITLEPDGLDFAGDLDTDTRDGDTVTAANEDLVAVGGLDCTLAEDD
jgi:hypothetical protein